MDNLKELSIHPRNVAFTEALLQSKGLMFYKKESVIFPFSSLHKGFTYQFRCESREMIEIYMLLRQMEDYSWP